MKQAFKDRASSLSYVSKSAGLVNRRCKEGQERKKKKPQKLMCPWRDRSAGPAPLMIKSATRCWSESEEMILGRLLLETWQEVAICTPLRHDHLHTRAHISACKRTDVSTRKLSLFMRLRSTLTSLSKQHNEKQRKLFHPPPSPHLPKKEKKETGWRWIALIKCKDGVRSQKLRGEVGRDEISQDATRAFLWSDVLLGLKGS